MDGAWFVTLTGELVRTEAPASHHAPGRSAARDATSTSSTTFRLTQTLAPDRLAKSTCLRSLVARLESRTMTSGTKIEVAFDGRTFAAPLASADHAVLAQLEKGEREGSMFSVSLRARAWDHASFPSSPAPKWSAAAEQVLHARTAFFGATHTHSNLGGALACSNDSIVVGPFERGTSAHLVVALLLGLLDDAPRKSACTGQASTLASLDGAREDLGNAFVDAWLARETQTHSMRLE